MPSRRKSREHALQVLYLMELSLLNGEQSENFYQKNFSLTSKEDEYARQLIAGVASDQEAIDSKIQNSTDNWRISRMNRIDRNILRIAVFEMTTQEDVPPAVAINEAVELAKKYGEEKSKGFINGVLDQVAKELVKK